MTTRGGDSDEATPNDGRGGPGNAPRATGKPTGDGFDEDLWLDRLTRKLGFGWLAARLPGDLPPSVVYTVTMLLLVEPSLNLLAYVNGEPIIYVVNPYFLLQPLALVGAALGAHALRRRYHRVMQEMEVAERASDPERLLDIVPGWLPWAFFLAGAGFNFARVAARGGFGAIYAQDGLGAVIAWAVVNPFIWAAIAAQFLAVYLSVEILAPWRLSRSDVGVHFRDPEGLGGLRPIGELLKHAYYYLAAGLVAYALILYHPFVESGEAFTVTGVAQSVFTLVWIGTVLTVAVGVFVLHRFMHREKRRELKRLERQANQYIQDPWDIATYEIPDDKRESVDDIQARMDRVSATNEYPATFSIWSQLLLSIGLPKLLQLSLTSL